MENDSSQGMKVPLIVVGVALVVVLAGVLVRSFKSSSSPQQAGPEPAPVPALASEPMPASAPEPSQQIRFSSLAATDDSGGRWTLGLKGVPPRIPEDCTKAGAPLVVKADVRGSGPSVSIGLIIQGQAGEVYEPGAARNGRRMPAPKFKVFDESDAVIGSGSFEYG